MKQIAFICALSALILFGLVSLGWAQDQKLSETEQLKIQIANLQVKLRTEQLNSAKWIKSYGECQTQILENNSPLIDMLQQLDSEIEKNHVGFDFDLTTGVFTAKPAANPTPKK